MQSTDFQVVVVGGTVSAAVREIVVGLSERTNLAVIAWCPTLDATDLRGIVKLPVTTLVDRAVIAPGRVYLAPRDRKVAVEHDELLVGGFERAPLDVLFRAIADSFAGRSAAVLLAGIGSDGSLGIQRVKEAGGLVIAQRVEDETSELPQHAIQSGLIDLVLPLDAIIGRLVTLGPSVDLLADESTSERNARTDSLRDILALVRARTGHDFASYKRATLFRRIARRMQVTNCTTLDEYHRYLRENPPELPYLLRDFLISVTNFFRDLDVFVTVANDVIPELFLNKKPQDQIRVWVAGCATGEEAYSLAILMTEYAETMASPPRIQIFATDIDERALAEARLGRYSDAIVADISVERQQRFFVREHHGYRVVKELRELVLFSPHNVLRDPPFSRLDLVTCRNLLIYLDRDAQQRVLSTFHFALRSGGVLLLGSSESAEATTAFGPLDPKARLYSRRAVSPGLGELGATPSSRWAPPVPAVPDALPERAVSLGELHYRVVESYAPPSALVNPNLDVIHLSEHAGRYLQLAGGEPTRQILRLVRPELQLDLRSAIYSAQQSGSERRIVRVGEGEEGRSLEIRVRAIELPNVPHGSLLVLFEELPDAEPPTQPTVSAVMEPVLRELEDQLHRTRDQLRGTIEQYETSLEELKASNEELQAINEELRSATEELETSKEELQSVNEELTTLNHELKAKIAEISSANSDLQNLMTSTEIGVIFLDRSLNIKRFTPRIQDVFNIIPSDIGRPVEHVTHRFVEIDLVENAKIALQSLRTIEERIAARDGRSFLVRWLPYRSVDDRIDGVVITLIDVSDLRDAVAARERSETVLEQTAERLRVSLRTAPIVVFSFDAQSHLTWAYILGHEIAADKLELVQLVTPSDATRLVDTVRRVFAQRAGEQIELGLTGFAGTVFDLRVEPGPNGVTLVGFDITARKQAETTLRDADTRKDEFLATLSHELRNPLAPLKLALEVARITDSDPEQRGKNLEVMDRQVGMLSQLVDELLDLSRISHGKVHLDRKTVELGNVLDRAVEVVRHPDAPAVHVTGPGQPIFVAGDTGRLVQIFTNLLANAAKFTPPTGRIDLATIVDSNRQRVTVKITDNGAGIVPELLPLIFELFVQSRHPDGRSRGGLGIGLNVVRRLVEMHGGAVAVASGGVGKGSTFTVELPLAAS